MNEGKARYFAGGLYWGYCDPGRPKIRFNNKVKNFSISYYIYYNIIPIMNLRQYMCIILCMVYSLYFQQNYFTSKSKNLYISITISDHCICENF